MSLRDKFVSILRYPPNKTPAHKDRFQWDQAELIADELLTNLVSIGWVAVTETGDVHQSEVSNAYQHMFGHGQSTRKSVRKIYATEGKAAQYSPIKKAKEVFIHVQ